MVESTYRDADKMQTFLDNIPGGIKQCLNDKAFTIVDVNKCFLEMFGFSRSELAENFNNHFLEMIHPADRDSVCEHVSRLCTKGDRLKKEYRVLCRDGSYKWVMDNAQLTVSSDGEERVLCVLLEVPESKEVSEELRLALDRFQIITNQTEDIIFEWNILNDTFSFSPNWLKKFGYSPASDILKGKKELFSHIHPKDFHMLTTFVQDAKQGLLHSNTEVRIQNSKGRYIWCRVRLAFQYDLSGKPFKAVGVITDIDEEKHLLESLRQRAERDALTGLYNRTEIRHQIEAYLETNPKDICALFMVDTDNFKQVNDIKGHLFGDSVLAELASSMKKLTHQNDLVGRIGGDEFTIFLKNIPSVKTVHAKASLLLKEFSNLFQEEKHSFDVSCSIGAAIYPDNGEHFEDLYHSADMALYQAKKQGKNQYVVFDPETTPMATPMGHSTIGSSIDSNHASSGDSGELVSYVFQVLYGTDDVEHAIQLILEIVGKRFEVSRAYIFENSLDNKYCNNTYEWCNTNISPQKHNFQCYPYDKVSWYKDLFLENSVFYCRDTQTLPKEQSEFFAAQQISSTLQCAINDKGNWCGFVGFDECTGVRMWTKEEMIILSIISQMLTVFLQKRRSANRDNMMAVQLGNILDIQNAYIYVIDQMTYELLYLNRKTRDLDPSVRTGVTCHKAFFKKEQPCENCPFSGTSDIYNPSYDMWYHVQTAPITWDNKQAYLISCYVLTERTEAEAETEESQER